MTKEQIIAMLKKLNAEVRNKFKAEIKGIFGSYSRDEAEQNSDIDVLVEFLKGATLLDLTGLGYFLEEKLGCKVDLVSQRAIRKEVKPYIERELIYL
jgi:predicted nucleotidyltransferase